MPKISIVLPVYNGEKYLAEAIDSIINQTFKDWELIIVNDCSKDSSEFIVREFMKKDERIKLINNNENKKLPESLNVGFREAKGEFLTWTSDDNIYEINALEEMYTFLSVNKQLSMVVGNMEVIDEDGVFVRNWKTYSNSKMAENNVVGACFLYKAEILNNIGEYDTTLFLVEDYEYWLRIISRGYVIGHIDKKLYKYRIHGESLTQKRWKDALEKQYELRCRYFNSIVNLLDGNEEVALKLYIEMQRFNPLSEEQMKLLGEKSKLVKGMTSFDENEPTIVYGAGAYGEKAKKIIPNIEYYADRDKVKVGNKLNGIEIISIDDLIRIKNSYQIVIAIQATNIYDVLSQLNLIGVNNYCLIQTVLSTKKMDVDQYLKL